MSEGGWHNARTMKPLLLNLRTPVVELRCALARHGRRTEEDFDQLVLTTPDCHGRISVAPQADGHRVRCMLNVEESRLITSGLELFNRLTLEGHPLAAYGAGRGEASFEFEWQHPRGADWRVSAQRVEILMGLLTEQLCAKPAVYRPRRKVSPLRAELLDGVLAQVSAA